MSPSAIILAWLLLGVTMSCRQTPSLTHRPSILIISVDTLRPDHLGCYSYSRSTSPAIDAMATRGVVFDNAVSTSSWTLPAHASMLTGLYPSFHGLQDDGVKLAPTIPTLAESLQGRGYHTLAVVSHVYVSSAFGLERGFDDFDDSLIEDGATNPRADAVVDRFLSHMRKTPDGPYFGFLHLFDPHWDYSPPSPYDSLFTDPAYRGTIDGTLASMGPYMPLNTAIPDADLRQLIGLYDGEIAYMDAQIGRLLDSLEDLGKLDKTVILFTADHGEEFKDHNRIGHGKTLFGEQLKVPLIVMGHPSFPSGTRRSDLVSLIDIAPTLIDLAAADPLPDASGHSLIKPLATGERIVFAESIRFGHELRAVRGVRHKMIHYLRPQKRIYFDLQSDPLERRVLKEDPSGGTLSSRLAEYSALADRGWHIKLSAPKGVTLKVRARISTPARIVSPRHYFSGQIDGRDVRFAEFGLNEAQDSLTLDAVITHHLGEVVFQTDPPGAPVTFRVMVEGQASGSGLFLGAGEPVGAGESITLLPSDARVRPFPEIIVGETEGCFIRSVVGPADVAPNADLSSRAIERLRSLGYIGSESNPQQVREDDP